MTTEHSGGYCAMCRRQTLHVRTVRDPNRTAAAVGCLAIGPLGLLFGGSRQEGDWYCSQCGTVYHPPKTWDDHLETAFRVASMAFGVLLVLCFAACGMWCAAQF